jgi:enamine deaminase RidA (YjgF/YER057c/UK114 family)
MYFKYTLVKAFKKLYITGILVGTTDNTRRRDAISKVLKDHMPCMTVLYVAGLASPAIKVEIDAWACADA